MSQSFLSLQTFVLPPVQTNSHHATLIKSRPHIVSQLSKMMMFENVSRENLEKLVELCPIQTYQTGQTVFSQGTVAENAMILVEGKLRVNLKSQTQTQTVGEIHSGEIFGEQGLFHRHGSRCAHVVASKPSLCLQINPKLMKHSYKNDALVALEIQLIAAMARRIRRTNLEIQKSWKASLLQQRAKETSWFSSTIKSLKNLLRS